MLHRLSYSNPDRRSRKKGDKRKGSPQLLQWTIGEKSRKFKIRKRQQKRKKIWYFKETNTKKILKNVAKDKNKTRKKKTLLHLIINI